MPARMTRIFELGRRCAFFRYGEHDWRLRVGSDGYCWIARLSDTTGQVLHTTEQQPTIGGMGRGATLLAPGRANLEDSKTYAGLLVKAGYAPVEICL